MFVWLFSWLFKLKGYEGYHFFIFFSVVIKRSSQIWQLRINCKAENPPNYDWEFTVLHFLSLVPINHLLMKEITKFLFLVFHGSYCGYKDTQLSIFQFSVESQFSISVEPLISDLSKIEPFNHEFLSSEIRSQLTWNSPQCSSQHLDFDPSLQHYKTWYDPYLLFCQHTLFWLAHALRGMF